MSAPSRRLLLEVARSLDAPAALAPHLDRVFARLDALGAMPRRSAVMLARHLPASNGRGRSLKVLDAACGKGAVGIALARRVSCEMHGFDAYTPFVEEAQRRARRAGVGDRCRFECVTAEAYLRRFGSERAVRTERFDAAMMLNLWPARRAARALRKMVRPGGVYLIDDATLDLGHPDALDFESMPTLAEMNLDFARLGDTVLEVFRPTPAQIKRQEASLFRRIKAAAHELVGDVPRLRPAVRELLRRQTQASGLLVGPLRPTLWIVRRGRG